VQVKRGGKDETLVRAPLSRSRWGAPSTLSLPSAPVVRPRGRTLGSGASRARRKWRTATTSPWGARDGLRAGARRPRAGRGSSTAVLGRRASGGPVPPGAAAGSGAKSGSARRCADVQVHGEGRRGDGALLLCVAAVSRLYPHTHLDSPLSRRRCAWRTWRSCAPWAPAPSGASSSCRHEVRRGSPEHAPRPPRRPPLLLQPTNRALALEVLQKAQVSLHFRAAAQRHERARDAAGAWCPSRIPALLCSHPSPPPPLQVDHPFVLKLEATFRDKGLPLHAARVRPGEGLGPAPGDGGGGGNRALITPSRLLARAASSSPSSPTRSSATWPLEQDTQVSAGLPEAGRTVSPPPAPHGTDAAASTRRASSRAWARCTSRASSTATSSPVSLSALASGDDPNRLQAADVHRIRPKVVDVRVVSWSCAPPPHATFLAENMLIDAQGYVEVVDMGHGQGRQGPHVHALRHARVPRARCVGASGHAGHLKGSPATPSRPLARAPRARAGGQGHHEGVGSTGPSASSSTRWSPATRPSSTPRATTTSTRGGREKARPHSPPHTAPCTSCRW